SQDSAVTEGMTISLVKVGNSVVSEKVAVPFGEDVVYDTSMMIGERRVQTPGTNGERLVTYEITYRNGIEVGRTEIESVVITEPKNQVVTEGTKAPDPNANIALGE